MWRRLADWLVPASALRWRFLTGPPSPGIHPRYGTPNWEPAPPRCLP